MGIYSEYLDRGPTLDLMAERKKQLSRIAQIRKRDILVYASDSNKAHQGAAVTLDNSDILPITDQLSNLNGSSIDVLLETGGGRGETAEDILRSCYRCSSRHWAGGRIGGNARCTNGGDPQHGYGMSEARSAPEPNRLGRRSKRESEHEAHANIREPYGSAEPLPGQGRAENDC
jgi:hypothetical protein